MATTRLYVLVARKAPVAVVFRRGPSKQVALVRWSTDTDTFAVGQWLKGRIYERRCDLSPGGDRLLYFAASWRGPYQSWTAVCRPPWLTALALWPKGDAWGGGGLFDSENVIALNHPESQLALAGDKALPRRIKVQQHAIAGRGEDWPIWSTRLARDGWTMKQSGATKEKSLNARIWIEYDPPCILTRPSPVDSKLRVELLLRGIHQRDGAWYVIDHALIGAGDEQLLAGCEWADWDRNGDLLFARDGCLYRAARKQLADLSRSRKLIDLTDEKFVARQSPPAARQWL